MSDKERSLDAAMVVKLKMKTTLEQLEMGAQIAFESFPRSNCRIQKTKFVSVKNPYKIDLVETDNDKVDSSIQKFINNPMDLKKERGIRQCLIRTPDHYYLVTRMHHGIADGMSFFLWLRPQFSQVKEASYPLQLKEHKLPVKVSKYAYDKASTNFNKVSKKCSNERKWHTINLKKPKVNFKALGVSYNDLLSVVLFDALREYNTLSNLPDCYNGIYLPMNLRINPSQGFGNGSSRVKIYDQYDNKLSYINKAKSIRTQLVWCRENGLWATKQKLGLLKYIPEGIT